MGWLRFGKGAQREEGLRLHTDDEARPDPAAARAPRTIAEATNGTTALQVADPKLLRAHERLSGDDIRHVEASLESGTSVHLIDLSRSGAHFECLHGFLPNAIVTLHLSTPDGSFLASGRVVRSRLIQLQR